MDVSQIRDYQVEIFSYKYLNRLLTPAFENLFTFNRDRHDHNTRKADNLIHEFTSSLPPEHLLWFANMGPIFGIDCPKVWKMCLVFRLSRHEQRSFFYLVNDFDVKPAPGCHSIQGISILFLLLILFSIFFLSFSLSLFPFFLHQCLMCWVARYEWGFNYLRVITSLGLLSLLPFLAGE